MQSNKEDSFVHGCAETWCRDALNCSINKQPSLQTKSVHITTHCNGLRTTYASVPGHEMTLLM